MEDDIIIDYSLCELEGLEDCVLGQSGFTLSGHVFTQTGLTIAFVSNILNQDNLGGYDNRLHFQSVNFSNQNIDCYERDVTLILTINVPINTYNTSTTTLDDILINSSTGQTYTFDVSASLQISGNTVTGTTRVKSNAINEYNQYLNISGVTLISSANYDRNDSLMFKDAHELNEYMANIDAQLVFTKKNSHRNSFTLKFNRDFMFYLRRSNCFTPAPVLL